MRADIDGLLQEAGGVAERRVLLDLVGRAVLDEEVRRRRLVRVFRRVYARPADASRPEVRERAALLGVGTPVFLTHTSALRRWGVLRESGPVVHVGMPVTRSCRPQPGLRVHRLLTTAPCFRVEGALTVGLARALVQAWTVLPTDTRRRVVIDAVRRRLVTPDDVRAELELHVRLAGRHLLADLVDLVAEGCESELEIWGHRSVFTGPAFAAGRRQVWIDTAIGSFRADLAFEAEKVVVEMDGWAFHADPAQRERDLRRDAALAAAGWLVLRFTHRRLHEDPAGCRRDVLAALAARAVLRTA